MAAPVVNDQFWFDHSKDAIVQGAERCNKAAEKLATALMWLWGIYSASVSVGVAVLDTARVESFVLVMAIMPIPVLLIGYALAVWAQVPTLPEFDPRSPTEIQMAYSRSMISRRNRLTGAISCLLASSVLVSVAIIVQSTLAPEPEMFLRAAKRTVGHCTAVAVTRHFPPNTAIRLRVIPYLPQGQAQPREWQFISSPTGSVQVEMPLSVTSDIFEVLATWDVDGTMRSIGTTTSSP